MDDKFEPPAGDVLALNPCPRCGAEMTLGELQADGGAHMRFVPRDASFWDRVGGGTRLTASRFLERVSLAAAVCADCDLGVFQSERDITET